MFSLIYFFDNAQNNKRFPPNFAPISFSKKMGADRPDRLSWEGWI
ncbi:hypothetical protein M892_19015 [Vibrio campbellii ATCC BAA-1116]|nr:hypothetical protein M892_19015 [Vibrio campbellii ATCC BAA-1116]